MISCGEMTSMYTLLYLIWESVEKAFSHFAEEMKNKVFSDQG